MTKHPDLQPTWGAQPQENTVSGDEVSILGALNVVLRNRRLISALILTGVVLAVILTLLQDRTYTSTSTFVTEVQASPPDLANVAAQFGVDLGGSRAGRPPGYYADLLESRVILQDVLTRPYQTRGRAREATVQLLDLLEIEADNERLRTERGLEALRALIETEIDRETSMIRYAVTMPSPYLAQAVAGNLLSSMLRFNLETRQSQARQEREFVESRLAAALDDLQRAQLQLASFLEANRNFEGSAQKQFEYENLNRQVLLRQQLFASLSEALESARIAEVKNLPALTIIDAPQVPASPDSRRGLIRVILAVMLGGFIGVVIAFIREIVHGTRRNDADAAIEFQRLRTETWADVRRPWRLLARRS